jgi:uncharacterized YccA/Bax inhibitor family protein
MAARRQQTGGSTLVASNFNRLSETFPGAGQATLTGEAQAGYQSAAQGGTQTPPETGYPGAGPGYAAQTGAPGTPGTYPTPDYGYGTNYQYPPQSPPPPTAPRGPRYGVGMPPVSDSAPFVAADVYNKVGILVAIAIAGGAITFLFQVSVGIVLGLLFVAFGLGIAASFLPRQARILAPLYAIAEGLALGGLSRYFETTSKGIVPLAILFTGGVFIATLAAYRSGLVHVGRRFVVGTMVATFGLAVVILAAWIGVPVPGFSGFGPWSVVIGVLYLVIGIANLLVDFSFVQNAEQQGLSAEGEWYAAFSIMLALVLVYLAILRILAGGRR